MLVRTSTSERFVLTKKLYTFGRDKRCDFVFSERSVSSVHCKLTVTEACVLVRDVSLNGTFVDGVKIQEDTAKMLPDGGELRLAPNIVFQYIALPTEQTSSSASASSAATKGSDESAESESESSNHANEDVHPAFLEKQPNKLATLYECGEPLGSGAYAEVRLCTHRESGKRYAAKIVDKKKFAQNNPNFRSTSYLDEIAILKAIRHPYIVSVEDACESPLYLTIILQYVEGGDLFDKVVELGRFNEGDAKIVFKQMVDGLAYLHDNNIAHRDLKPENYLVLSNSSNVHIVMADFGLAKVNEGDLSGVMKTMCGTPQYLAPELMVQMRTNKITGYTQAVDMWSLGVILFILLVGYPPFGPKDFDNIIEAKYDFRHIRWKTVSVTAKTLVSELLTRDPQKRLTVHQAAAHAWLKNVVVPPAPLRD